MNEHRDGGEASVATRGFSLVELLVVIAIIAILLSLIFPLVHNARQKGMQISCMKRMQAVTQAWTLYGAEHDSKMVSSNHTSTNGEPPWLKLPSHAGGDQIEAIRQGALFEFVGDIDNYKCTNPIYPEYSVSYSISAMLNGETTRKGASRGAVSMGEVNEPSLTMVLIEEDDARGWLYNSWMIFPEQYVWVDFVAGNHMLGDNLAFADGHAEHWKWKDPDTLTIYQNSQHFKSDPGSVDLERLRKVFKPRREN